MFQLLRSASPKMSKEARDALLARAVQAVVDVHDPVAIYAVGSILNDDFDESSDIDLVVVVKEMSLAKNAWRLRRRVREKAAWPIDLVYFDVSSFEAKKNVGGMAYIAAQEGKAVFRGEGSEGMFQLPLFCRPRAEA